MSLLPDKRVFECTKCAICCHFKVFAKSISRDDNGIFYTVDKRSRVLSLWRWEADRFRERANELGLKLLIRPLSFIVDEKSSKAYIILWYLDTETCPFLKDDLCSIREDRTFSCKQFPLYGEVSGIGLSSSCPDLVRPPLTGNEKENGDIIKRTYPDQVPYLYKDMEIFKMVFGFVRDLEENHILEWNRDADLELGKLMINDPEARVDLFDLVMEQGVLERSRIGEVFDQLDSVDDVKDRIELRISKDLADI